VLAQFDVFWMGELLRSMNLGQYSITAAQPGISAEAIRSLKIPIPPLSEQQLIGDFLRKKTARLSTLLGKKRELIVKLKEKRSALISRTVTKGLPPEAAAKAGLTPNPNLKPSGIEWLGDIPEQWDVRRSKMLFRLFGGYAFSSDGFSKEEDDFPALVTPGSFSQDGGLQFPAGKTTYFTADYPKAFSLKTKDLLIVLTDLSYKKLILGRCVIVDRPGLLLNQRVAKILIHDSAKGLIDHSFLIHVLNSRVAREQLIQTATGTTVFHSSPTKVGECILAIPPKVEQTAIASYLDTETTKLDSMIQKVESAIEKLTEYRTALITAAVTGKIDVRHD